MKGWPFQAAHSGGTARLRAAAVILAAILVGSNAVSNMIDEAQSCLRSPFPMDAPCRSLATWNMVGLGGTRQFWAADDSAVRGPASAFRPVPLYNDTVTQKAYFAVDADGNTIIPGWNTVVKVNRNGTILWEQTMSARAISVAITNSVVYVQEQCLSVLNLLTGAFLTQNCDDVPVDRLSMVVEQSGAAVYVTPDKKVIRWDPLAGVNETLYTFQRNYDQIAITSDGGFVLSSSGYQTFRYVALQSKQSWDSRAQSCPYTSFTASNNGTVIAYLHLCGFNSYSQISGFSVENGSLLWSRQHTAAQSSLPAVSPSGAVVWCVGSFMEAVDAVTGSVLWQMPIENGTECFSDNIVVSGTNWVGAVFATADNSQFQVRTFVLEDGSRGAVSPWLRLPNCQRFLQSQDCHPLRMALSRDSRIIVAVFSRGLVSFHPLRSACLTGPSLCPEPDRQVGLSYTPIVQNSLNLYNSLLGTVDDLFVMYGAKTVIATNPITSTVEWAIDAGPLANSSITSAVLVRADCVLLFSHAHFGPTQISMISLSSSNLLWQRDIAVNAFAQAQAASNSTVCVQATQSTVDCHDIDTGKFLSTVSSNSGLTTSMILGTGFDGAIAVGLDSLSFKVADSSTGNTLCIYNGTFLGLSPNRPSVLAVNTSGVLTMTEYSPAVSELWSAPLAAQGNPSFALWPYPDVLVICNAGGLYAYGALNGTSLWAVDPSVSGQSGFQCSTVTGSASRLFAATSTALSIIDTQNGTAVVQIPLTGAEGSPTGSAVYMPSSGSYGILLNGVNLYVLTPCWPGESGQPMPTVGSCDACPPGTYRLLGQYCVSCPPGQFCPPSSSIPLPQPGSMQKTDASNIVVSEWHNVPRDAAEAEAQWNTSQSVLLSVGAALIFATVAAAFKYPQYFRRIPQTFQREHPTATIAAGNTRFSVVVVHKSFAGGVSSVVLFLFGALCAAALIAYYHQGDEVQTSQRVGSIMLADMMQNGEVQTEEFAMQIRISIAHLASATSAMCNSMFMSVFQNVLHSPSFELRIENTHAGGAGHPAMCVISIDCPYPCEIVPGHAQCVQIEHPFSISPDSSGIQYIEFEMTTLDNNGNKWASSEGVVYPQSVLSARWFELAFLLRRDVVDNKVDPSLSRSAATMHFVPHGARSAAEPCSGSPARAVLVRFNPDSALVTTVNHGRDYASLFAVWFSAVSSALYALTWIMGRYEERREQKVKVRSIRGRVGGESQYAAGGIARPFLVDDENDGDSAAAVAGSSRELAYSAVELSHIPRHYSKEAHESL